MLGYLGFDGFTSTFQDKLFKGYFENVSRSVVAKICKLQQERISVHYELCRNNENDIEIYPFDCFWE